MNSQMAYLLGMIFGNGEILYAATSTTVTVDIPYKKLEDDFGLDVSVYIMASLADIRSVIEPLVGIGLVTTRGSTSIKISFTKPNEDYLIREIIRLTNHGTQHKYMQMSDELLDLSVDDTKELLRGIADVTGHIRRSNIAYGQIGAHRVYIEVPGNWDLVIKIVNLLKKLGIPVQNIDFGHPNFRDSKLVEYNRGKPDYWKKEHQVKIYANEFLPIGFNIKHKQKALEIYAEEAKKNLNVENTHQFYWEKPERKSKVKPSHPGENDSSLPKEIRGKHYDRWIDLAYDLGYRE